MPLTEEQRDLFTRIRSENLSTEIKETIDLSSFEGQAKLIKACQAIYNRNGGYFLVGFDNSGSPKPLPDELLSKFTIDRIQELISKHSKPTLEIDLDFLEISGSQFPVVIIPTGVRVPTSVRKQIRSPDGNEHLPYERIYFRTLLQNGRASTSPLRPDDFSELLEVCFSNRETDIASFFRKHLSDIQANAHSATKESIFDVLKEDLIDFDRIVLDEIANLSPPKLESWLLAALTLRVAVACDPALENDGVPTESFLSRVYAVNPNLTGWPVWMDSQNFHDRRFAPHVSNGGWNAIIAAGAFSDGLDVYRFLPSGKLFLRRVLQDDTSEKVERGKFLDPALMVYRVAEVVIVGLSILKGIGAANNGNAHFRFEWTGLRNRKTTSWSDFNRYFSSRTAFDDSAASCVSIPMEVDVRQISPFVSRIVRPLFATFEGFEIAEKVVEELVAKLIERRW